MRVKQPEPFDREREYKPGERAIVNGAVFNCYIMDARRTTVGR
jgi:hypothetical protein